MSTPLYGGWRRAKGLSFGLLDSRQTFLLAGSILIPLFIGLIQGVVAGLVLAPLGMITAIAAVWTRQGVWVMDLVWAWRGYSVARSRGQTHYRGQMWAEYPRRRDLPGVLARTRLLDLHDPGRGQAGIVWNPGNELMSATLLLSPSGALLSDQDSVTYKVASWGNQLATLADNPAISHAAVTIEMVPALGPDLAEHVAERTDPAAPQVARDIMASVVAAAPTTTTRINARMTLSVDTTKTRARDLDTKVTETLRALGSLSLNASGVDVLRRASATDLVRIVRTAYEPGSAQVTDPQRWDQVTWDGAGPVAAQEEWGYYVHDDAYSMTFCLVSAPRQYVTHDVLLDLLIPGPFIQRLTLLYRTLSREQAGLVLKREKDAASAKRIYDHKTGRDPSARNDEDEARAQRAAAEEAQGAGLTEFSLFITVTTQDFSQLQEARDHVEQAASKARLQVRPAWGGQGAAFAVGLGVAGLYPPDL